MSRAISAVVLVFMLVFWQYSAYLLQAMMMVLLTVYVTRTEQVVSQKLTNTPVDHNMMRLYDSLRVRRGFIAQGTRAEPDGSVRTDFFIYETLFGAPMICVTREGNHMTIFRCRIDKLHQLLYRIGEAKWVEMGQACLDKTFENTYNHMSIV